MATRTFDLRNKIRHLERRLDRGRRLYRRMAAAALAKAGLWERDALMDQITSRMLESSLQSGDSEKKHDNRQVRYGILRQWWRDTPGYADGFGWYRWCHDFKWEAYTWTTQIPVRRYA